MTTDNNLNIVLSLEDRDADELVLLLQGYYRLLTDKELPVHQEKDRWADDAAPPYHTQHRVQAAGWSYPSPKTDGETSPELSVDLSTNPTYKPSPQKVLTANGHLPNISGNTDIKKADGPNVAMMDAVVRQLVTMDRNMNKMPDAPLSPSLVRAAGGQRGILVGDANKNLIESSPVLGGRGRPFNFRSVVSMEVAEDSEGEAGDKDKGKGSKGALDTASCVEACNDEVIRRVTEMQQIVRSAEKYLTGNEEPPKGNENGTAVTSTTASATAEGSPRLKAADSLLLLTQVGREADLETVHVSTGGGGGGVVGDPNEPSGSDTDSLSTPTDSPSHRPQQQQQQQRPTRSLVGSSFGLHSPDNLPVALQQTSLQELLRRLQDERRVLPFPMAENGGFYLDPDIIDLTMIPPPATPDREGFDLPAAVSMPPTPFADRQTLEAELRALEAHFQKETRELEAASSYEPQAPVFRPPCLPAPPLPAASGVSGSGNNDVMELPSPPPPPPQGWGSGDIDSFIASVTVPPPPEELRAEPVPFVALSPVVELTPEDISAFIIPPPPASSSSDSDVDMIARLQEAADSINEVVEGSGTLRGSRQRPTPPPGRFVLHLQNRFDGGGGTTKAAPYAGDSSGYETQNSSILSFSDGATNPLGAVTSSGIHPPSHGHYVTSTMTSTAATVTTLDRLSGLRQGALSSMSDNASTVSGGSSTASGGTQADTEDSNAEDQTPRLLRPTNVCLKTTTMTALTSPVPSSHLVTNGISSPLREESAASSESEDAASVCHMSASSSDDGNDGATSPFRRQMSIPRSLTSPLVAKRAQWSQLPVLQRSQSLSSEQGSPGSGYTSPTAERTSPRSLHSSSSGENIQPGGTSSCGNSPTRSKANSSLVMEKGVNTGTILKSPHMSPARAMSKSNAKGSVKPPLPPSPTQDIPRRVLVSPVDVKRLPANGSSTIQVPKPVLPKSPNLTTSRSPSKRVPSPSPADALVNGRLKSPAPSPTHSSRTPTPTRSPLSGSKLPRPKGTLVGCGGGVVIDNSDISSLKGSLVNGTDSSASSPSIHDSTSGSEDIFNFASPGLEDDVADLVNHEAPLQKAEIVVGAMVARLDEVLDACGQEGQVLDPDRDKLVTARDALAVEARRFVTASKLFVKSATESEEKLLINLGLCVSLLDRMLRVTETLALNMGSPLQTQNLALKVRDVAATFVQATRAAAGAVGRPMQDPSMNTLMQQATTLAAVLTALMRTLRAFNP